MPSAITSPASAMAFYTGAVTLFSVALGGSGPTGSTDGFVINTGLMTDEFMSGRSGSAVTDQRINTLLMASGTQSVQANLYTRLQAARVAAFQARQALQLYAPTGNEALISRMYSLEAYSIVYLAEYFCNGIPLSMSPLTGPAINGAGQTTDQLLAHAEALFDTAAALSADSSRFLNLALVGKARALVDQGQFAQAATTVANVPLTFVYAAEFKVGLSFTAGGSAYKAENALEVPTSSAIQVVVTNHEGVNGLVWTTDPRIPTTTVSSRVVPSKYQTGNDSIRVADGLEAQLIRAEASFNAGTSDWLTTLNTLRATCTTVSGCAPVPNITAASLPALPDSGTALGRLREIMMERAYWMYATGHRAGDLRRLLRPPYSAAPYGLTSDIVYPIGAYVNPDYTGAITAYGSDVVAMPSTAEQLYNSNYTGCFTLNP
jgi:hypothetical protein